MKKKLTITLVSVAALVVVFFAWAVGVAMGQKNGGLNGEYNKVVHNAVLLRYINEGRPEAAENWMRGFIKDGVETLERDENTSLLSWFKLYANYHKRPPFSDSLKPTIDDVVANYQPNTIDLSKYKVTENDSGFSVEIPSRDLEEESSKPKDAD